VTAETKTLSWANFLRENAFLLSLALIKLFVHIGVNARDSVFRDELYYIACGKHLAFGYVDHPPFIALMAALSRWLLGDSIFVLRLSAAFAGAAMVFITGLLARELGGKRFAQNLAALCALLAPIYLGIDSYFSMNAFDQLFWLLGAYLLVLLIKRESRGLWLAFGAVMGLGLMNKISLLFFGFGLSIGILLTPNRRWLLQPWIWLAGGIAFLIFLPHILWQALNGWPTLEFIHNASQYKNASLSPWEFIKSQILLAHPFLFPIWLAGLLWFFFNREGKRFRLLGWIYISAMTVFILKNGKPYYLAPAYTFLFAAGALIFESGIDILRQPWLKPALCTVLIAGGALSAPMAMPILPTDIFIRFNQIIGVESPREENHEMGVLPQFFADRYGWREMTLAISEVYNQLSPEDRRNCAILAENYGQAGAIDYFGRALGLPNAVCGHNNYFLWGPGDKSGDIAIVYGFSREDCEKSFEIVEQAALFTHPYVMPFENNKPIFLCRKIKKTIQELWPQTKHYI